MVILDGKKIADKILENIKLEVSQLPFVPVFCDVLVGDDPASAQYVKMKAKTAEKTGIKFFSANFPKNISTTRLATEIKKINTEPNICGLIVQLPLPGTIDKKIILDTIDPVIDVDCTGSVNADLFYQGKAYLEFPTAAAIIEILKSSKFPPSDMKILVVGFGQLVGRPVSFLLRQKQFNVEVASANTLNISELFKNSNVIISAVGKPGIIAGDNIKPGSIIIDAGTSESNGGIVGDVDFESVKQAAGFISPVPGGVGPVTVAKLLGNVLQVAKIKAGFV